MRKDDKEALIRATETCALNLIHKTDHDASVQEGQALVNESKELKSLIEYVASQVSLTNEKVVENDKLAQKIASMEKQLKKIEKNVAAITEYIDEEDTEEDEFFDEDDSEN